MAKKPLPSPEELRQLLRYDPETGKLFWRERTPEMFTDGAKSAKHSCRVWNSKYAGTEAFTCADAYGYRIGRLGGLGLKSHRVIYCMIFGHWPDGDVDHINGNRSDNRISNLRNATRAQNLANRHVRNGASKFIGVSRVGNGWAAHSSKGNKTVYGGYFESEEDAARGYDKLASRLHGEFASLNFPQ